MRDTAPVTLELGVPRHVVRVGKKRVYAGGDLDLARQAARIEARDTGVNHVWIVGDNGGLVDGEARKAIEDLAGRPES